MDILEKFKILIDENFIEEHDIAFYERQLDVKPKYLSKISKKLNAPPPCQILLQKQINHSKQLLSNTEKAIKQIAFDMNFEDEYYFSRIFKTKTGLSPTEYRNAHK